MNCQSITRCYILPANNWRISSSYLKNIKRKLSQDSFFVFLNCKKRKSIFLSVLFDLEKRQKFLSLLARTIILCFSIHYTSRPICPRSKNTFCQCLTSSRRMRSYVDYMRRKNSSEKIHFGLKQFSPACTFTHCIRQEELRRFPRCFVVPRTNAGALCNFGKI